MADLRSLFRFEDAMAAGLTRGALRHALTKGRIVRVRRSVYAERAWWDRVTSTPASAHAVDVVSVMLQLGTPVFASHASAAALYGLPLPQGQPAATVVTATERRAVRRLDPGRLVRAAELPKADRALVRCRGVGTVPATGVARTCVDLAREFGFTTGLVAADAALRRELTSSAELRRVARSVTGWSGSVAACGIADVASGLRESPKESESFALFVVRGLTVPECNPWVIGSGAGGVRADFWWRRQRVVGEVDGAVKYIDPFAEPADTLLDEKRRQERIEDRDQLVVRWGGGEVGRHPDAVIARITRASARAHEMYGAARIVVDPGRARPELA